MTKDVDTHIEKTPKEIRDTLAKLRRVIRSRLSNLPVLCNLLYCNACSERFGIVRGVLAQHESVYEVQ